MANLKFFKNSAQPQSATAGSIWFNTTLKTIEVYNGTTWEKFAGKLLDANWNTSTQKLTISKADGSSIDLDFSNIASLSGVQAALSALENKLQGNIDTVSQAANAAKSAADAAQAAADAEAERATAAEGALGGRIDGVAADIATEATNRQTEDNKLADRISTLESTITGLNGTLHFRGVQDEAPADPEQGDFYITTQGVEYIYDGTKWEKIGDTSAESASIAALEGRMTTAEGDIDANAAAISALQTRAGEIEAKNNAQDTEIAKKAVKTEVEASISGLQAQITSNDNDITALQGRADALEGRMDDAEGEIDTINQTLETLATAENLEALETRVAAVETKSANNETEIGKTNSALNSFKTEVADTYATKTSLASTEAKAEQNKNDIEAVAGRMTTAEGKISTIEGQQTTQDGLIQENANAIAALEQWKDGLSVGVTSVEGDSYVTATPTSGAVKLSVNATTAVTKDSAALVTSGAVATAIESALEWEEFV